MDYQTSTLASTGGGLFIFGQYLDIGTIVLVGAVLLVGGAAILIRNLFRRHKHAGDS